jgi:hypothetical protein
LHIFDIDLLWNDEKLQAECLTAILENEEEKKKRKQYLDVNEQSQCTENKKMKI